MQGVDIPPRRRDENVGLPRPGGALPISSVRHVIEASFDRRLKQSRAAWEAGMLRVVCGQCGKKLEIPDAWARNVVKCPQCREPINLQEHDSAECAVKLGQFLNENLAGGGGPGGKFEAAWATRPGRPSITTCTVA